MNEQNHPRKFDAVLGTRNNPPNTAAVLGGLPGLKQKIALLTTSLEIANNIKTVAETVKTIVREAAKYEDEGLYIAYQALESLPKRAYQILHSEQQIISQRDLELEIFYTLLKSQSSAPLKLNHCQFETVEINLLGEVLKKAKKQTQYYKETLGINLEMLAIPGGFFKMGTASKDAKHYRQKWETPQHEVNVNTFCMSKYPITHAQYLQIMKDWEPKNYKPNNPAYDISWYDATEFCRRLSQKTGRIYRLPTEAEWEYACRAGTTTPFHFGPTITADLANYNGNYTYGSGPKGVCRYETTDVNTFLPNAFGLCDMHGNVWEWCQDVWHDNYNDAPTNGEARIWGREEERRVARGGGLKSRPEDCRSASRTNFHAPQPSLPQVGFRIATNVL